MKNEKNQKAIEKFLSDGGVIEKLETVENTYKPVIRGAMSRAPDLKTLSEGANLYGKKIKRKRKVKVPDFSNINVELIPEHLRNIINKVEITDTNNSNNNNNGEETNEAD